jgi:hypothetical protein
MFKKTLEIKFLAQDLVNNLDTQCPVLEICVNDGAQVDISNLEYLCMDYYFLLLAIQRKIKDKNNVDNLQKLISELMKEMIPKEIDIIERCKVYATVMENSKPENVFYMIGRAYSKFIGVPDSVPVATSVGVAIGSSFIANGKFFAEIQKSYKFI